MEALVAKDRVNNPGYDQEDEYFHQRDLELLAKKRAQLDAQRMAASGPMNCPRCGSAMTEVPVEHVKVDRCTGCGGVFIDKGEMEVLTHAKSGGIFRRLFGK
jgi:Zn-finger nucleic acid-binding protein